MKARRAVQAASLLLFLLLLLFARDGGVLGLPADLYLRLDPLAGVVTHLVCREIVPTLAPVLAVLVLTALCGRLFCGWFCPMGASLDLLGGLARVLTRRLWPLRRTLGTDPLPRTAKYLVLAAVLAAALVGENLDFWASPIPLVTRLYALVLVPLGAEGLVLGIEKGAPLLEAAGATDLLYLQVEAGHFRTALFVLGFWLVLLVLECVRPRFWCRYLCPAGGLLAIVARLAQVRLRRAGTCVSCGRCAAVCPAGLNPASPIQSHPETAGECLVCLSCVRACRHKSLRLAPGRVRASSLSGSASSPGLTLPTRRSLCLALAAGPVLSLATGIGPLAAREVPVRAPGSRPEEDFLARCLRCGACMRACPTSALQPVWFQSGVAGLFSPALDPRTGACLPECARCGEVCPTATILALPLAEKKWARVGIAVLKRDLCLAWAQDKRCMVCKENCPYGAVDVVVQQGHVAPVPVVDEKRCFGCGFCEHHCPKPVSAIVVESRGALRLAGPGFEKAAKKAGFILGAAQKKAPYHAPLFQPEGSGESTAPPGFLE